MKVATLSGGLPALMTVNSCRRRGHIERAVGKQRIAGCHVPGDLTRDRAQAEAVAVGGTVDQRQQLARLGVEDEEQAVEQDQAVVVDGFEVRLCRRQPVGTIVKEALGEVAEGLVHLRLEPFPHVPSVVRARGQQRVEARAGPGSNAARRKNA